MLTAILTREELLRLIQKERPDASLLVEDIPLNEGRGGRSAILAVWKGKLRENLGLPSAIVMPQELHPEFFAWTQTYLSSLQPLTAFCRVITPEQANLFFQNVIPDLAGIEEPILGLIACEAATYLESRRLVDTLGANAFLGTFSFSAARGLAIGIDSGTILAISDLWATAKSSSSHDRRGLDLNKLVGVWRILLSVLKTPSHSEFAAADSAIARILRTFINRRGIDVLDLRLFESSREASLIPFEAFGGTREERIFGFNTWVNKVAALGPASEDACFLSGFLMSLISGGNLDHLKFLSSHLEQFPTALLWYGVCTGFYSDNKLRGFGNGMGRRILRELLRELHVLESPTCDIALAELRILMAAEHDVRSLNRNGSNSIDIELLPGVSTVARVSISNNSNSQVEFVLTENDLPEPQKINPLEEALSLAESLRQRILEALGKTQKKNPARKGRK